MSATTPSATSNGRRARLMKPWKNGATGYWTTRERNIRSEPIWTSKKAVRKVMQEFPEESPE